MEEVNSTRRGHKFVTKEMMTTIPDLYATEDTPMESKTLYAHYFLGGCDWYVAELDKATGEAFGHADLVMGFPEWGYFSLVELEATTFPLHQVVERELDFTPCTLAEALEARRGMPPRSIPEMEI